MRNAAVIDDPICALRRGAMGQAVACLPAEAPATGSEVNGRSERSCTPGKVFNYVLYRYLYSEGQGRWEAERAKVSWS